MKIAGFDSPEDLAEKIDYEGGIAEYFIHYSSLNSFKDDPEDLYLAVKAIQDSYKDLENVLNKYGISL